MKARRILTEGGAIASLVLVLAALVLVLLGVISYGYATELGWVGVADKTLWDWLELLIVPFVLAVGGTFGGYLFTRSENRNAERIAEQRSQDAMLLAYLDQMKDLLLDKNLRCSEGGAEVRTLARARTLLVLARLDAGRRTSLMRFLSEVRLVQSTDENTPPVIYLRSADLRGAALSYANLIGAYLSEANLRDADLREADLSRATLTGADLIRVGLSGAGLTDADLTGAKIIGADLSHAILCNAKLGGVNLSGTSLGGARLYEALLNNAILYGVDLSQAHLYRANLNSADLRNANLNAAQLLGTELFRANLQDANLKEANLKEANLKEANLTGATGLTDEQLTTCKSLEGATMPDGSKHP